MSKLSIEQILPAANFINSFYTHVLLEQFPENLFSVQTRSSLMH